MRGEGRGKVAYPPKLHAKGSQMPAHNAAFLYDYWQQRQMPTQHAAFLQTMISQVCG